MPTWSSFTGHLDVLGCDANKDGAHDFSGWQCSEMATNSPCLPVFTLYAVPSSGVWAGSGDFLQTNRIQQK